MSPSRFSIVLVAGSCAVLLVVSWLFGVARTKANTDSIPKPAVFAPGIISTGDYDTHPAFSPTGDTLVFLKGSPNMFTWTLCISFRRNGAWTQPEVAPFSGQYIDGDPFFTRDGKELYFVSNRPLKKGEPKRTNLDIWKVRIGKNWEEPLNLGRLNSEADEYYPTISDLGTMYFGSERAGGKGASDLYRSTPVDGKYLTAENLGDSVNTSDPEYEPFIAADESFLIFMATYPGGLMNADLFVSYPGKFGWTRPVKLGVPFSSPATEWSPKVTRDGKYFFFGSTRGIATELSKPESTSDLTSRIRSAGNGLGDIYQVDFEKLNLKRVKK